MEYLEVCESLKVASLRSICVSHFCASIYSYLAAFAYCYVTNIGVNVSTTNAGHISGDGCRISSAEGTEYVI